MAETVIIDLRICPNDREHRNASAEGQAPHWDRRRIKKENQTSPPTHFRALGSHYPRGGIAPEKC
jgi:hypothetical protein